MPKVTAFEAKTRFGEMLERVSRGGNRKFNIGRAEWSGLAGHARRRANSAERRSRRFRPAGWVISWQAGVEGLGFGLRTQRGGCLTVSELASGHRGGDVRAPSGRRPGA